MKYWWVVYAATTASWTLLASCGGRTDGVEPDAGAPLDHDASLGTHGGTGNAGRGGIGSGGDGGRAGVESGGGRPGRGGAGGRGGSGRPGSGGGSAGGSLPVAGAAGAPAGCRPPSCSDCGSCFSACSCTGYSDAECLDLCGLPPECESPSCFGCESCFDACVCEGYEPSSCRGLCDPGVGGAPGFCDPGSCASQRVPLPGLELPGCCLNRSECGLFTGTFASFLGIEPTCVRPQAPGRPDPSCPPPPSGPPFPGCCLPTGVCGTDLSVLGLGCVSWGDSASVVSCGAVGTGGQPGAGGLTGQGGASAGGAAGTGAVSGTGGAPLAQCLDLSTTACEVCACGSCLAQLLPCFQNPGCPSLLQCANRTGCTGLDCYQPSTCRAVIDAYGGPTGQTVAAASSLFGCLVSTACPCGFGE